MLGHCEPVLKHEGNEDKEEALEGTTKEAEAEETSSHSHSTRHRHTIAEGENTLALAALHAHTKRHKRANCTTESGATQRRNEVCARNSCPLCTTYCDAIAMLGFSPV